MKSKHFLIAMNAKSAITGETQSYLLFSHGLNAHIEANTYLCCDIASRGYIVASVGHTYEAIDTDFEDGSFAVYDKN